MAHDEQNGVLVLTSPRETDELLERLQSDGEFRQRLEADPRAALGEYRIELADELLDRPVSLPSPDELAEARKVLAGGQFSPETSILPTSRLIFRRYLRRLIFKK